MHKLKPYYFALFWLGLTAILQLIGVSLLRYEQDLLTSLELWRLITAHGIHLNWLHWLLNSLGLVLLIALTQINWKISFWVKVILIHCLTISCAFLVFNPLLSWYVGFSGVLYGLYMLAGLLSFKNDKLISAIIICAVTIKIAAEQWFGASISSQSLLGAPVIVDAHAYGLLCGLILGIALLTKVIKIN